MRYNNYHKHDDYGNPWSTDVIVKPDEYGKRAVELGHTTCFTTNHGMQGNIFEWLNVSNTYNLKMIYGTEAYYVKNRKEKDRSNRHIIVIAKNNDGAMELNDLVTEAHSTGFYYRPRIDNELLFNLNPHNFIITTACIAGIWNDSELILSLNNYFDDFFLEVQDHDIDFQKTANQELLNLSSKAHIPIIHANDSHYIYPADSEYRDIFLRAKRPGLFKDKIGSNSDEDSQLANEKGMILDYPDSDTIFERYEKQGILNRSQVQDALDNTLIFDECEPITIINDDIKLPSVSENPMEELREIVRKQWKIDRNEIPKSRWPEYTEAISDELNVIEDTNMANYFLIDYNVAKVAQEKYGGKLTNTGRGSAPSFYVNKLLGLTNIDRINAPVTLFPSRFMSTERILGSRSLPDKQNTIFN